VEGKDASYHSTNVDCKHHIVVLGCKTADQVFAVEVGKQVHYFLKQKNDFVVWRKLAFSHISEVLDYLSDLALEPPQCLDLLSNATFERIERDFLDFSEQMLDSDLFWLGCFDLRFNVEE